MTQCRLALKPDGLFLASLFGGETLQELRIACSVAQMEREGGISPFISPLAQVRQSNTCRKAALALCVPPTFCCHAEAAADLELHEPHRN